jgi:hypothetical protein
LVVIDAKRILQRLQRVDAVADAIRITTAGSVFMGMAAGLAACLGHMTDEVLHFHKPKYLFTLREFQLVPCQHDNFPILLIINKVQFERNQAPSQNATNRPVSALQDANGANNAGREKENGF